MYISNQAKKQLQLILYFFNAQRKAIRLADGFRYQSKYEIN
jgi:hypothetical protein